MYIQYDPPIRKRSEKTQDDHRNSTVRREKRYPMTLSSWGDAIGLESLPHQPQTHPHPTEPAYVPGSPLSVSSLSTVSRAGRCSTPPDPTQTLDRRSTSFKNRSSPLFSLLSPIPIPPSVPLSTQTRSSELSEPDVGSVLDPDPEVE